MGGADGGDHGGQRYPGPAHRPADRPRRMDRPGGGERALRSLLWMASLGSEVRGRPGGKGPTVQSTTIPSSTREQTRPARHVLRWVLFGLVLLATISAAAALPVLLG